MMLAMSTSITHNLEPPNHLANTKETNGLGSDDANSKKRIGVHGPYSAKKALLCIQTDVLAGR